MNTNKSENFNFQPKNIVIKKNIYASELDCIEVLRRAIKLIGSQQKLALLLKVDRRIVNNGLNGICKMPVKYALRIEAKTNGKIKAEDLAPDAKEEICIYQKYLLEQHIA